MEAPLQDRTIALAEGRQLEELAQMLEKEGAATLRCPLVSIRDVVDPAPVLAWLRELVSGKFAYVVFFTGEGLNRLLGWADREGLRKAVVTALGQTRTVVRGPKPVRALREVGLAPTLVAREPTTEGIIATLRAEPLAGQTVGVQLYHDDNLPLRRFLEEMGASVRTVLPYEYGPASDAAGVADLVTRLAAGCVDALVFTSSAQVERLFEVADQENLIAKLKLGLARTRVAAVGPLVADTLRRHGAPVHICPEQGFVMKNLVQLIKKEIGQQ